MPASTFTVLTFQVGPDSWIYIPIDAAKVRSISFSCDWRDGSYSLYINGEKAFSRLKRTEYHDVDSAIEGG